MSHRSFDVAPWGIGWHGWEESRLARRESVFSLANGHLGWRGTLDEGDPLIAETMGVSQSIIVRTMSPASRITRRVWP